MTMVVAEAKPAKASAVVADAKPAKAGAVAAKAKPAKAGAAKAKAAAAKAKAAKAGAVAAKVKPAKAVVISAKAKADAVAAKAKPTEASAKKLLLSKRTAPKLSAKAKAAKVKAAKVKAAKAKAEKAKPEAVKLQELKEKKEKTEKMKTEKRERKEKKRAERKDVPSGEPKKSSKKALAIAANLHCRQIFIGNLPANAGEKELMEMLKEKKFQSAVRSIRVLKSSNGGKKAKRDDQKKVIPRSRGAAFIRLKSKTARDAILKEKDWKVEGKTLRVEMAGIKKSHTARLAAQAAAKKKQLSVKEEGVKKHKVTMHKNLLKNKKHDRNLHLKLRRATSKKGNKTAAEKRRIVSIRQKLRAKKAKTIVRSERKQLYGIKARKAMVRMSRK